MLTLFANHLYILLLSATSVIPSMVALSVVFMFLYFLLLPAIALAYKAYEEGYRVSYTTMQSLMQTLRTHEIDRRSKAKMNRIQKSNLLVVDEVGYLPITSTEGNLFFQLISELQEQTSIIITTNKGFEEWAEFLDDAALATAILDRLSYRCDRIQISGKSYRLENRKSFLSKGDATDEI